jgi:uncharacterized membrane protein YqgA involved in biofilm formation
MIYSGSLVNAALIVCGTFVGLLLKKKIPQRLHEILFQCSGMITLFLGFSMAMEMKNLVIVVISLMLGALVGEYFDLENKMDKLGDKLKSRLANNESSFTQGFVAATLLYCIGSMSIIGAMDGALRNNHSVLITKGIIDGFMSIVFASAYGIGVLFSILPLLIYQCTVTTVTYFLESFFTDFLISQLTGLGGFLILGLGISLLKLKTIKVMNFMPSFIFAVLFSWCYELLWINR